MIRLLLMGSTAFFLSSCALLAEGGLLEAGAAEGLAARAAITDGAALSGEASLSAEAAASRGASFFVDGSVRLPRGGHLAEALNAVEENRATLLIKDGVVRAGSREIGEIQGAEIYSEGRLVGHLREGVLTDGTNGDVLGRLRGFIPRGSGVLELSDGSSTPILRTLSVDILEYSGGRYVVKLASGETATYAGVLSAAALTPVALAQDCDDRYASGFALRVSGELVPFNTCDEDRATLNLGSSNSTILVDRREIAGIIYVTERTQGSSGSFAGPGDEARSLDNDAANPPVGRDGYYGSSELAAQRELTDRQKNMGN